MPESASYTTPRTDVSALLPHVPGRLLDIGCSDGTLASTVREQGRAIGPLRPLLAYQHLHRLR